VEQLRIGVLTCSDTRSRGEAEDTAGRALKDLIEQAGWTVVAYHVCPDDPECISASLMQMADVEHADFIFTCGGTGVGPRDVTPEATLSVTQRLVPGIAEFIRAESMRVTQRAMLSRGLAAQRGNSIIINLPGSEKAARESFGFVAGQLEHGFKMMHGGGHS